MLTTTTGKSSLSHLSSVVSTIFTYFTNNGVLKFFTEKDYTERLSQQAEQIADLKLQLEQSQADKHRLTDQLESKIVDNSNR